MFVRLFKFFKLLYYVCNFEYSYYRLSTCFEPTISNFLSAHKNIGKVVLNQMSVETIPVLNTANRYSGKV